MDINRRKNLRTIAGMAGAAAGLAAAGALGAPRSARAFRPASGDRVMWLDHLALQAGDPSVRVSFNAVTSGVGGGLAGLIIESSTLGDQAASGGNKVVEMGVQVPPGYLVTAVRLGYELSGASHVSQIRLAQVKDPPAVATVQLDDATAHTARGPVFVDSAATQIDPALGPLLLSLRLNIRAVADRIVVRGLGLYLRQA